MDVTIIVIGIGIVIVAFHVAADHDPVSRLDASIADTPVIVHHVELNSMVHYLYCSNK